MKLADWQKKAIQLPIHEIVMGRSNDYNTVWDAIDKACSGGMRTNGPDYMTRDIRAEIKFAADERGPQMTAEQLEHITLAVRRLFRDRMP